MTKTKFDFKFLDKAAKFVSDNGSTLSMIGGIATLAGALYAAFKASDEVSEIKEKYVADSEEIESRAISEDEKAKELKDLKSMRNIRLIFAEKWAIILGVTSGGLIFLTKYLDGLAITGLTALAVSQQDKIKSMAKNAKEMLGEEKFVEFENKNLDDLVRRNFFGDDGEPLALRMRPGEGEVYVCTQTGALFQAQKRDIEAIIQNAESYCARNHELYEDKWFDMLGLAPDRRPNDGKVRCWGPKNPFKAHIGRRELFNGNMSCLSIEYDYQSQPPRVSGAPWKT